MYGLSNARGFADFDKITVIFNAGLVFSSEIADVAITKSPILALVHINTYYSFLAITFNSHEYILSLYITVKYNF